METCFPASSSPPPPEGRPSGGPPACLHRRLRLLALLPLLLLLPLLARPASAAPPSDLRHIAPLAPSRAAISLLTTAADPDHGRRTLAFDRDIPCALVPLLDAYAPDAFPRNPLTDPDYPAPLPSDPIPLRLHLTFDLPASRALDPAPFLLLSGDADRAPVPLGEAALDAPVPHSGPVSLLLGPAPGITAIRTRTAFRYDPATRTATESFSILLRNATDRRTTVHVLETFPRSPSYTLTSATHESRPGPRPSTLLFPIDLAPSGNATLSYAVRYDFPATPTHETDSAAP